MNKEGREGGRVTERGKMGERETERKKREREGEKINKKMNYFFGTFSGFGNTCQNWRGIFNKSTVSNANFTETSCQTCSRNNILPFSAR